MVERLQSELRNTTGVGKGTLSLPPRILTPDDCFALNQESLLLSRQRIFQMGGVPHEVSTRLREVDARIEQHEEFIKNNPSYVTGHELNNTGRYFQVMGWSADEKDFLYRAKCVRAVLMDRLSWTEEDMDWLCSAAMFERESIVIDPERAEKVKHAQRAFLRPAYIALRGMGYSDGFIAGRA